MTLKIFNILGSPDCEMLASLSLHYMHKIADLETDRYKFYYAIIHHDGKIAFIEHPGDKSFIDSRTETHEFEALLERIEEVNPDVIIYHVYGTKGSTTYRSALEILDIPILGSTADKHFITNNKALTRNFLQAADVCVAPGVELYHQDVDECLITDLEQKYGYPLVVKAATVENSEGVFIATNRQDILKYVQECFLLSPEAVVIEKFIAGREIRCAVIEDENENPLFLPVIEYKVGGNDGIRSHQKKLNTEAFETSGMMKPRQETIQIFLCQKADAQLIKDIKGMALKAFNALELHDFAIFDLRVDKLGKPYILEVNLFCSFNATSCLNYIAKKADISDEKLLEMTINNVLRRHSKKVNPPIE